MPEDLNLRYKFGPFSMAAKYHYAWVIVALMSVIQMAGGSIRNIFGVLIDPLQEQYGWQLGDLSAAYAIASLTAAVGLACCGLDRRPLRRTQDAAGWRFAFCRGHGLGGAVPNCGTCISRMECCLAAR